MLLGVDVAGILSGVLGSSASAATLVRYTPGTRTGGAASAGTNPASTSYPCRGWIESFDEDDINGTLITQHDRKITLIGGSLPAGLTPNDGDQITIADLDGTSKTFRVVGPAAGSGPQGAFYICQARL
jgi:hypothetical protein